MSEKTALEKVLEYFIKEKNNGCYQVCIHDLIAQLYVAKEIEEEQHLEKWQEGWNEAFDFVQHFKHQGVTIKTNKNEQTKQS